ncbi:Predicted restriction endonuclease [Serratia grimesii]|jgi:5-methylcytosine-specific restriction protein A|uniref:HNH endonuclease n=1 Tax=Serratia grimesii TaxID=82995 RepID=UPI00102B41D2|nr:HNH endonuclease [Serratia grimesii]CAI1802660.1 Predicted restriction endonuclease [Serratia grimesii]
MINDRDAWGDEDLEASVLAYIEMKKKHDAGEAFTKTSYYKKLGERFGRSPKSFEYRMQNISYAYSELNRNWLKGLKPASHVGSNKLKNILELISIHDKPSLDEENKNFDNQVENYLEEGISNKPTGNSSPAKAVRQTITIIRDPMVKAYVLQEAKGVCESCGNHAPFSDSKNKPYLEVHHLKHLADGGSDTVENTVAICPNCHRALHYSKNKNLLIDGIYKKVMRLVKEN